MNTYPVNKSCPDCLKESVVVSSTHVMCSRDACDFSVGYCCPFCQQSLSNSCRAGSEYDDNVICSCCSKVFSLKKIGYLIENGLVVDYDNRCGLCNGPTIHRQDINLAHRCFYFPGCSGQKGLFGQDVETLVFLDFETTGLEIGKDSLIEIGALKIDEEGYEHTFQTFIKPPDPISEHISKITGITQDLVDDAPDLVSSLKKLVSFIGSSKIIAHNTDFDIPWLLISALRHEIRLTDNPVICTYKWAQSNQEERASLKALCKKYGIGQSNAHRALADAVVTKELFFIFENQKLSPRPILSFDSYMPLVKDIFGRYADYVQA